MANIATVSKRSGEVYLRISQAATMLKVTVPDIMKLAHGGHVRMCVSNRGTMTVPLSELSSREQELRQTLKV